MASAPSNPVDLGAGLDRVLARLNRFRAGGIASARWRLAEEVVEELFRPSRHLAVYGTLVPGGPNHSVVEPLGGDWLDGRVRGQLSQQGWGTELGYPAMRWDPAADEVPVRLLVSEGLAADWDRLDRFEGPGYLRILVPVRRGEQLLAVANLYEGCQADY